MDTFTKYKNIFRSKVHQDELGLLAGLNLKVKKVSTDKLEQFFIDKFMFLYKDSKNKWIPIFILNSNNQKVFRYEILADNKKFTVILVADENAISDDLLSYISSKFNSTSINFVGEIPREFLRDCQDDLNWQVLDKSLLILKGISVNKSILKEPTALKSYSSLSKAERAIKVLKKDQLYIYQQKFNAKK